MEKESCGAERLLEDSYLGRPGRRAFFPNRFAATAEGGGRVVSLTNVVWLQRVARYISYGSGRALARRTVLDKPPRPVGCGSKRGRTCGPPTRTR